MLLAISTVGAAAPDLSFLLHKRPDRAQSFELGFGRAHVFYPENRPDRCTACLLLDVDPVGLVRGKSADQGFLLSQYVNDRGYAASSFLSVALAQVFGSALNGRSAERAAAAAAPMPLEVRLEVLPVRGGDGFLRRLFEPLGYAVEAVRHPLDDRFPAWGDSPYFSVALRHTVRLAELLAHLYVLVPVFDNRKHYFVGEDETEKLLAKGDPWLAKHPEREEIVRRYLRFRPNLYRSALAKLAEADGLPEDDAETPAADVPEAADARLPNLNEQRLAAVAAALKDCGARRVLDLGCGEGKLLQLLAADRQFAEIVGVDVSVRALDSAARKLRLDRGPGRTTLLHGSLLYRDERWAGFDAAALVEVVEHLDPPRLAACERSVFGAARPATVVVTTPNREYNATWPTLPAGQFRHADHRFEWTRAEFRHWAGRVAGEFGYAVAFQSVGAEDPALGPPTQMAVFRRTEAERT